MPHQLHSNATTPSLWQGMEKVVHARPGHWKASIDGESMSKGERVWPCERRHDAEHVACLHQCTQHYNLISSRRKLRLLTVSSPVCACVCVQRKLPSGGFGGPVQVSQVRDAIAVCQRAPSRCSFVRQLTGGTTQWCPVVLVLW